MAIRFTTAILRCPERRPKAGDHASAKRAFDDRSIAQHCEDCHGNLAYSWALFDREVPRIVGWSSPVLVHDSILPPSHFHGGAKQGLSRRLGISIFSGTFHRPGASFVCLVIFFRLLRCHLIHFGLVARLLCLSVFPWFWFDMDRRSRRRRFSARLTLICFPRGAR